MKANEIRVGKLYAAKVSNRIVTVRVDVVSPYGRWTPNGQRTMYYVTNLSTGRKLRFHSAAKFRHVME